MLHHTGQMWRALEAAGGRVKDGGLLFIAIYADRGAQTARWKKLKKVYCQLPKHVRPFYAAFTVLPIEARPEPAFWSWLDQRLRGLRP